ncbi:hypothetical protein IFM89_033754 [Coptis chinensis]|uniref:Protein kinase domain-containing protein n=1 Tax=Coptis chinensis TaxID=261450 RepID=A0A835HP89_9MAGN|nr:hypothetical protein IFM89_033754 [Coptis chinensis]
MASFPAKLLLLSLLVYFISLSPLIQANLNLDQSDFNALLSVEKSLGIYGGERFDHPCDSFEIYCEARTAHDDITSLRVTRIVLDSKRLNGTLSLEVGKFSELKQLTLSNNQLVDSIPQQIVDLKKLQVLNLRNNRLSGQIPPGFSSLVSLKTLDLSSNRFSGNLNFLKHFPNLENLSLSDNLFSGKVPVSLRSFRNLRFFNLSGNIHLHQDSIPKTLTWVETDIDTYSMPKRYILAERNKSFGWQISPAPSPLPSPSHPLHRKPKKNGNSTRGWIVGFFVGLVTGMISAMIFSLLFKILLICIKGRVHDSGPVIFSKFIKKREDLAFLGKEDGLASLEIIGRGGCGEVYKAQLPASSDCKIIAIKKVVQPSMDIAELTQEDTKQLHKKMRQIRSEIQTVGQIRHRNLVPLLAHVSRPDCHYLVYEFMKNGKEPSDEFFEHTDELNPVKWLRNVMTSEDPSSAIDLNLIKDGPTDQMLLVLKISCFCTLEDPKERPNSKDIRSMLSQVKN